MDYYTKENIKMLLFVIGWFLFPVMVLCLSPNMPLAVESGYFYGYVLLMVEVVICGCLVCFEVV